MEHREIRLEDLLSEIGYGEIRITVVNGRLFQIPVQRIERPSRHGLTSEHRIGQPLRLKAA